MPKWNCLPGSVVVAEVMRTMNHTEPTSEEKVFTEFRNKVRDADLLSAAMEKILRSLRFSGRLCVVVQNGSILKSGYEEGYFTRRLDERMVL